MASLTKEQALEHVRRFEAIWHLPEGTVDAMVEAVGDLRDGAWVLYGIGCAAHNAEEWVHWLLQSEDHRVLRAVEVLKSRLEGEKKP